MALKREFLTTNEVAEMLGISPFTIRRYIQLRKLKAVKLEGSYRVRRVDLEALVAKDATGPSGSRRGRPRKNAQLGAPVVKQP